MDLDLPPFPAPLHLAVGLPGGRLVDPSDPQRPATVARGAVRRGGSTIVLPIADFEVWVAASGPADASTLAAMAPDDAEGSIRRLWELGLLVWFDTWEGACAALSPLRVVPGWSALGHLEGDPHRFWVEDDPEPVVLDPVEALLLWEFDGRSTVGEAIAALARSLPSAVGPALPLVATRLVVDLAGRRKLRLDGPDPDRSARP